MERRTLPGRLIWQRGEIIATRKETERTQSITIALPGWMGHRPGQHVDVRLTAEDGYQVERSYSIASPPEEKNQLILTIERLDDGEVSPYLVDELRIGDQLELRGPIGGYFVWEVQMGGPLLLIAGGSGIVPLMAMIRHAIANGGVVPIRLLFSSRSEQDIIYHDELSQLVSSTHNLEVIYTLTREQPQGWTGYHRRVDSTMLREVAWLTTQQPLTFICGPTSFVEAAATSLVELGYPPERVKTERFGATGDG
ncbi:ferredoxin reductase [Tengunoibacter tsumagoiensis]|uniref:Oxidoreductase n=1 Tax=Tengunoibacter tsumagoiensis TaxID=2014871 RepID=A0A402AAS1_9CHLR|nr:ferredoxin reductase [Tengunoibacter tsumagoiensis]GCE16031.1 oxidoreductase [Tengunoibacter tsumagoiensis]